MPETLSEHQWEMIWKAAADFEGAAYAVLSQSPGEAVKMAETSPLMNDDPAFWDNVSREKALSHLRRIAAYVLMITGGRDA